MCGCKSSRSWTGCSYCQGSHSALAFHVKLAALEVWKRSQDADRNQKHCAKQAAIHQARVGDPVSNHQQTQRTVSSGICVSSVLDSIRSDLKYCSFATLLRLCWALQAVIPSNANVGRDEGRLALCRRFVPKSSPPRQCTGRWTRNKEYTQARDGSYVPQISPQRTAPGAQCLLPSVTQPEASHNYVVPSCVVSSVKGIHTECTCDAESFWRTRKSLVLALLGSLGAPLVHLARRCRPASVVPSGRLGIQQLHDACRILLSPSWRDCQEVQETLTCRGQRPTRASFRKGLRSLPVGVLTTVPAAENSVATFNVFKNAAVSLLAKAAFGLSRLFSRREIWVQKQKLQNGLSVPADVAIFLAVKSAAAFCMPVRQLRLNPSDGSWRSCWRRRRKKRGGPSAFCLPLKELVFLTAAVKTAGFELPQFLRKPLLFAVKRQRMVTARIAAWEAFVDHSRYSGCLDSHQGHGIKYRARQMNEMMSVVKYNWTKAAVRDSVSLLGCLARIGDLQLLRRVFSQLVPILNTYFRSILVNEFAHCFGGRVTYPGINQGAEDVSLRSKECHNVGEDNMAQAETPSVLSVVYQSSDCKWKVHCGTSHDPTSMGDTEENVSSYKEYYEVFCPSLLLDAANTLSVLSVLWGSSGGIWTESAGRRRSVIEEGKRRYARDRLLFLKEDDLKRQQELLCSSLVVCAGILGTSCHSGTYTALRKSADAPQAPDSAVPTRKPRPAEMSGDTQEAPPPVTQDSFRRQALSALLSLRAIVTSKEFELNLLGRLRLNTLRWLQDEVSPSLNVCYRHTRMRDFGARKYSMLDALET